MDKIILDSDLDSKELAKLQQKRKDIESKNNITPLKEFGTNYAEFYHDGANGIKKILKEAKNAESKGNLESFQGQATGAFYRKDLGDIDLVWGKTWLNKKGEIEGFGLKKIIEKHYKRGEFEPFGKGENGLINALSTIIKDGEVEIIEKRAFIRLKDFKGVIALDYKGDNSRKWILTFYFDEKNKASTSPAYPHQDSFAVNDFSTSSKTEDKKDSTKKSQTLQDSKKDSKLDSINAVNKDLPINRG